jgi:hypothetical protein
MNKNKERKYYRIVEDSIKEDCFLQGESGHLKEFIEAIASHHKYIYIDINEGKQCCT